MFRLKGMALSAVLFKFWYARQEPCLTIVRLFVLNLFHFAEQVGGKNKIIEFLVVRIHHVIFCALPFFMSFINEDNILTNSHHRVHIVRVDDGCNAVFFGNALQ